jgi:hypothetical protein
MPWARDDWPWIQRDSAGFSVIQRANGTERENGKAAAAKAVKLLTHSAQSGILYTKRYKFCSFFYFYAIFGRAE